MAATYLQKMRETMDPDYLNRAAKIVDAVLSADRVNYEALRLRSAIELERQRFQAEQEARRLAEEAADAARAAAESEAQARDEAASGVCGVDLAAAIEDAKATSDAAIRAGWTARRAEKGTKVRITGGIGNAVSLQDHETLHVTDWKAAIEEMSGDDGRIPQDIANTIIKCARAHRKTFDQLPSGVEATYTRGL